jgi:hypothetical protein
MKRLAERMPGKTIHWLSIGAAQLAIFGAQFLHLVFR